MTPPAPVLTCRHYSMCLSTRFLPPIIKKKFGPIRILLILLWREGVHAKPTKGLRKNWPVLFRTFLSCSFLSFSVLIVPGRPTRERKDHTYICVTSTDNQSKKEKEKENQEVRRDAMSLLLSPHLTTRQRQDGTPFFFGFLFILLCF